jgi:hypothetical protein
MVNVATVALIIPASSGIVANGGKYTASLLYPHKKNLWFKILQMRNHNKHLSFF